MACVQPAMIMINTVFAIIDGVEPVDCFYYFRIYGQRVVRNADAQISMYWVL